MTDPDHGLDAAVAALDAGDADELRRMIAADPDLVRRRIRRTDPPYDGYFSRATLLHHVAGNPIRGQMPDNAPELARLVLDAGADVDAECGGGPAQPESSGRVLGLVASSGQAAERGLAAPLIDVLVEFGAAPEADAGGALFTALYHTVECQQQRDVARMLYDRGARADFGFAAGLGDLDRMKGFLRDDGSFVEGSYERYRPEPIDNPTREQILLDALLFACVNGREEAARFLLDLGADVNGWIKFGPWQVTPLHGVAWAGWPELIPTLVDRGADLNARDPAHDSSPPGWAWYCRRPEAAKAFAPYEDRFDLRNAVEYGCTDRCRELLADQDPNQPFGKAAPGVLLRAAAALGHRDLVELLLDRGADASLKNAQGWTAAAFAQQAGQTDIAALLRDRETDS